MAEESNLDCLLHRITPSLKPHFLSKTEARNLNRLWHPREKESLEYFTLEDLWDCYCEWSLYGAGVTISLDTGESLVQYYVPHLSAIQIFTTHSLANSFREETDSRDSEMKYLFSDSCSEESEGDKMWRSDGCSSEEGGFDHESLCHQNDRLGCLYFQYFETTGPYGRAPLIDKINELAQRYPGLMSLRSVDLSPASWMAISWYPIYHIPKLGSIKNLSTSFLSYHTLSSSFQDMYLDEGEKGSCDKRKDGGNILLPPFGLATYKMQGNVWFLGNDGLDKKRFGSLSSVAESWLKQLGVQHHDFDYFNRVYHN